jgi:hypothetical protein
MVYILLWSPNFKAPVPGGDYVQFDVASRIVRAGAQDRLYDFPYQVEFEHDPARMPVTLSPHTLAIYIYPPFFVWFCLPFSYLPFRAGASAWALFMSGCLIAALRVLLRTTTRGQGAFGYALLASVPFLPTLMSIYSCQNATLSLLILAATYALLREGRAMTAGSVFALQAFKPQLTLVIAAAMLYKRQWRFVLGGLLGGLALLLASLLISPKATADYLTLGPTMARWIDMPGMPLDGMACWQGFWRLLIGHRPLAQAQVAAAISSLLTLIPLARGLLGPLDTTSVRFPSQFAALVLGTILISPHLLYYDLTLLLIPMVLAAGSRPVPMGPRIPDIGWPWSTAILYAGATISRTVAADTGIQIIVPLILIFLIVLVESRCRQPAPPERGPRTVQDSRLDPNSPLG